MEPWSATIETARFCGTRRAVTRVFTRVEVAGRPAGRGTGNFVSAIARDTDCAGARW